MTPARARLRHWLSALCGAGCGLVLWVALSSALLAGGTQLRALADLQVRGLLLGALLAASGAGLLWPRAQAQGPWRTRSLLARVAAVSGALALVLTVQRNAPDPSSLVLLAVLASGGALGLIAGLALLETGDAGLQLPARLAQALLAGAALLFALIALHWPGADLAAAPVPSLALLALVAAGLLLAAWQAQGGLRARARRQGRWLALGLIALLPLLLAALLYLQPDWARVLWPLVALSVIAGTVVERAGVR